MPHHLKFAFRDNVKLDYFTCVDSMPLHCKHVLHTTNKSRYRLLRSVTLSLVSSKTVWRALSIGGIDLL